MISTLHSMHNDIKPPNDYSSYKLNPARYSPPESPRNLPSFFNAQEGGMNNSHRGLPPPSALQLQPPDRSSSIVPPLAHLPAPPQQWTGQDESMRNWLQAKAEEDRRRQEEEKTKQETLRLDQRKIEQNMLRESLQGGVPPPMVPLIFAGIGGGNLPSHTLEWAQQYLAQLSIQNQQQQQQLQAQQLQQQQQHQHQQQQQQSQIPPQTSPDMRRDHRMIPANPYAAQQPLQPAPTSIPTQAPNQNRGMIQPPPPSSTGLARLNTAELQPLPSASQPGRQPAHPLQQSQTVQSESGSAPSLFFHHWTPPSSSHQPPTPSGKSTQGSPFSQTNASHLRSEYQNSPKKRKTAGGVPQSQPSNNHHPQDTSPPYSSRSSRERDTSPASKSGDRAHSRHHSDASSRDADNRPIARPSSRQQRRDELSGVNHQSTGRPWTASSTGGSTTEENSTQ